MIMIQILTDNRFAKGQLSLLARDLGYEPIFHDSATSLLAKVSLTQSVASKSAVLIDIDLAAQDELEKVLSADTLGTHKIAFQIHDHASSKSIQAKPNGADYFFLLPSNAERAKTRLKNALRAGESAKSTDSDSLRSSSPIKRRYTRTAAPFKTTKPFSGIASNHGRSSTTRYLSAESSSSKHLVAQMLEIKVTNPLILIAGNDGCDFETVAREFNFQANADKTQLLYLDIDDLRLDLLEKLDREAVKKNQPTLCYVGKADDLTDDAVENLKLFVNFLENLRNPHLRILLAHEYGTEEFMRPTVLDFINRSHNRRPTLLVPEIKDRPEDIAPIALNILSTLRIAHPFLQVKGISDTALEYLKEIRNDLSEAKLIRILRNSIALSQRQSLQIEDIKNYGEHDSTTSHLVESMADEVYFPSSQTA